MPRTMIHVRAKKACLLGNNTHVGENQKAWVPLDMFGSEKDVPKHLEIIGKRNVSDEEIAERKAAVAKSEDEEKAALLEEAKDLKIKGVHKSWGLDKLREAVSEAKIQLTGTPTNKEGGEDFDFQPDSNN